MSFYSENLFNFGSGQRICPSCGTQLELLNPASCHMLNGIIFVMFLFGLVWFNVPHVWVWLILFAIVSFFINPLFINMFGKWGRFLYNDAEKSKARVLAVSSAVSSIVTAIWVGQLIFAILGIYMKIILELVNTNIENVENFEKHADMFKHQAVAALGFAAICLITSMGTKFYHSKLRTNAVMRTVADRTETKPREEPANV